jgi:hypothetical protein
VDNITKVASELALYQHPFFEFSAAEVGDGVEICIRSVISSVHTSEYRFTLSQREIDHPQFRWSFQGLLYGSMNDYMVELFTSAPDG